MRALLTILPLCLLGLPAAAEELRSGPWLVQYGEGGVTGVSYEGTPVLAHLGLALYTPDYRSAQFSLAGAKVTVKEEQEGPTLTFERENEAAAAVARLEIRGNSLRWSADVELTAAGPLEMAVPVPAAAVEHPTGDLVVRIGDSEHHVTAGRRLKDLTPREPVTLVGPAFDIILHPSDVGRWPLQDRRHESTPVVRVVGCLSSPGDQSLKASPSIEIEVRPLSATERRARELIYGQVSITLREIPVKAGDFEGPDALEAWSHGPNAMLDTDRPASGTQCARLEVTSPAEPNVYLTQQIPVTPGRHYKVSCKIRCTGVKAAEGMRMPSVGAVLIHEWADAEGKWMQAGDYSTGLWGDVPEWQEVECHELVAPEKAGYAVIFLGLRATGTAWFDDVKLVELTRHTIVLAPLDGSSLRDNRPTFSWRADPYSARYLLEVSGEQAKLSEYVRGTQFRPREPLPPGLYRWRVTAEGATPSVEWTFTQTAPQDADTTGPEVVLRPTSLTDPRGVITAQASDTSGIDVAGVHLAVDGKPWQVTVKEDGDRLRLTPATDWPRGGSGLTLTVPDRQGNETEVRGWLVCAPAPPKRLRWTETQGLFDGDRHFLPLGMYQVPPEHMERVKKAGFNLVHTYAFESSQDDEAARQYLDAAQAHGLGVFLGFDRGSSTSRGLVQRNWEHVVRRIGALRDHPALTAWYLFDEPDLSHQYVPPESLEEVYQLIKALDPYHPVIVTFAMDNSLARYPQCYDVHWTQVYGGTDYVLERLTRHRKDLPGGALAAILTCYDRKQSELLRRGQPVDDAAFPFTAQKFRADVAMALALRSSGLSWWWYGDGRRQWLTAADVPSAWEALTAAVAEVHQIEPLLTADGEELEAQVHAAAGDQGPDNEPQLAVRARKVGKRALVIVAQAGEEGGAPVDLVITVPALRGATKARVLFENREVDVQEGVIRDSLAPVDRHVYLIEGLAD